MGKSGRWGRRGEGVGIESSFVRRAMEMQSGRENVYTGGAFRIRVMGKSIRGRASK